MSLINKVAGRAGQYVYHFRGGRVVNYWPYDALDMAAKTWRCIHTGRPHYANDGSQITKVQSRQAVNAALTELHDIYWAQQPLTAQQTCFPDAVVLLGSPTRGLNFQPATKSYMTMCAGYVTGAASVGTKSAWGHAQDVNSTTPGQMWIDAGFSSAGNVQWLFSAESSPASTLTTPDTSSVGDSVKAALLWDHTTLKFSGWMRLNSASPIQLTSAARPAPANPHVNPFAGFSMEPWDCVGQAMLEFNSPPTNAFTVAEAIMDDWLAKRKQITRVSEFTYS